MVAVLVSVTSLFWTTFAMNTSALNYWDLLSLYFWALTPDWKVSEKPELKYTNIDKNSSLYNLLQKAVAAEKFPNLAIALPLDTPAYESDLAVLINYDFKKEIVYTKNKQLSFDYLLTELKSVYQGNKNTLVENKSSVSTITWTNTTIQATDEEIADSILSLLKYNYINKDQLSDTSSLNYDDLSSFVESLGEEYTVYYNPDEGKQFMNNLNWEFAWIWVYLIQRGNENPAVTEVITGSPAESAWIQAEDQLISIDWKFLSDYSDVNAFIDALKWEAWSTVVVQIKRGGVLLTKTITRALIQVPMIETAKQWGICYINLYSFDIWVKDAFIEKFSALDGCSQYVFDVRTNPGWVIDEVTWILDKFLPQWKVIMTEKGVNDDEIIVSNEAQVYSLDKPTYILIDWYTASAAEIFAWVLKHYYPNTVQLVGSQSYGKWSVQQVVQFPNDAIIKYTIAVWYIADEDTTINNVWLSPDIYVVDNPYTMKDEVLERVWIRQK